MIRGSRFVVRMLSSKKYPIIGSEEIMAAKTHGTSKSPPQQNLRWNCNPEKAEEICSFNRHYAERSGYFERSSTFLKELKEERDKGVENITFYDSITGKPLYIAPKGRTWESFIEESIAHGWPSFRDEEVVWENVRCLEDGEAVSTEGTHLGHNLPDSLGNRYCINIVSVAGRPVEKDA